MKLTIKLHVATKLFYAQVYLEAARSLLGDKDKKPRAYYLWLDGSLRPFATTRYVKDQTICAYFSDEQKCRNNIVAHFPGAEIEVETTS